MPSAPAEPGPRFDHAAVVSSCGTYRYELSRRWSAGPVLGWVMLNPSTADSDTDDATIRRCIGFARAWGYGGIVVRNLYALRATDPKELFCHGDPIGPANDAYLSRCVEDDATVLAWGNGGRDRGVEVARRLQGCGVAMLSLGVTNRGYPRHPLYVRRDRRPGPFSVAAVTSATAA